MDGFTGRTKVQEDLVFVENYRKHKREQLVASNSEVTEDALQPFKYKFLCFKKKYPSTEELQKEANECKTKLLDIQKDIFYSDLSKRFCNFAFIVFNSQRKAKKLMEPLEVSDFDKFIQKVFK